MEPLPLLHESDAADLPTVHDAAMDALFEQIASADAADLRLSPPRPQSRPSKLLRQTLMHGPVCTFK